MLVTTTNTVEGHRVVEYKGLVAARRFSAPTSSAISSPRSATSSAAARPRMSGSWAMHANKRSRT